MSKGKCKVIGCNNRVIKISNNVKHNTMKGLWNYCQIHYIDGLVESKKEQEV